MTTSSTIPPGERCDGSKEGPKPHADDGDDKRHEDGGTPAVHDAAQHVPTQQVGAEPVVGAGSLVDSDQVYREVVVRGEEGTEQAQEQHEEGDEQAKHGGLVTDKALEGVHAQAALAYDLLEIVG